MVCGKVWSREQTLKWHVLHSNWTICSKYRLKSTAPTNQPIQPQSNKPSHVHSYVNHLPQSLPCPYHNKLLSIISNGALLWEETVACVQRYLFTHACSYRANISIYLSIYLSSKYRNQTRCNSQHICETMCDHSRRKRMSTFTSHNFDISTLMSKLKTTISSIRNCWVGWDNSRANPTARIVCGVESAPNPPGHIIQ